MPAAAESLGSISYPRFDPRWGRLRRPSRRPEILTCFDPRWGRLRRPSLRPEIVTHVFQVFRADLGIWRKFAETLNIS